MKPRIPCSCPDACLYKRSGAPSIGQFCKAKRYVWLSLKLRAVRAVLWIFKLLS